jgi:hypothetical protein
LPLSSHLPNFLFRKTLINLLTRSLAKKPTQEGQPEFPEDPEKMELREDRELQEPPVLQVHPARNLTFSLSSIRFSNRPEERKVRPRIRSRTCKLRSDPSDLEELLVI